MNSVNDKGSKSYLFSIVSIAIIGGLLFGYDTAVISGAEKGLQAFYMGAKDFVYTDLMHGITSSSALIGCVIGAALSGILAFGIGRKKTLIIAGVLFLLSAFGCYAPKFLLFDKREPTFELLLMFNFYRIIGGIAVGVASAICPMYIAEISPSILRGKLVSWNQFAIIFGQLVVYFVNFVILGDHIVPVIEKMAEGINQVMNPADAQWAIEKGWRYMFVSEAIPAAIFTILLFFVPETPRYLTSRGDDAKALNILTKINGAVKAAQILKEIKDTVEHKRDKLFTYGWVVIFVGIMLSVFQQIIGINAVLYFAPRIFDSFGMSDPMMNTVIMGVVNIAFTLLAIFTVEKWGRKPLLIWGSVGTAIGAAGVAITSSIATIPPIVAVVSIMVYSASFMFSWGPICWVLISEIFPNTIRATAIAIAVAFQCIFNFIVSFTFFPMYNMSLGSMENFGHAFSYGLYAVISIFAAIFVWKFVPETKGKTLEDMTKLWKNKQ